MDIRIQIQPAGDTSDSEVVALSSTLVDQIGRLRGVESAEPVTSAGPDGAKGLIAELGTLLVGLPAGAITGVLDLIKAYATRPGSPPVTIKVTKDGIEGSFDPKTVTPDAFAALAAKLSQDLKPA
jgi:hypothetical protein